MGLRHERLTYRANAGWLAAQMPKFCHFRSLQARLDLSQQANRAGKLPGFWWDWYSWDSCMLVSIPSKGGYLQRKWALEPQCWPPSTIVIIILCMSIEVGYKIIMIISLVSATSPSPSSQGSFTIIALLLAFRPGTSRARGSCAIGGPARCRRNRPLLAS